MITPAAAAMPVACPEGNEKLVSVVTGSSQTGRLRCRNPLSRYVVNEAPNITRIVQTAARACLRQTSSAAVTAV